MSSREMVTKPDVLTRIVARLAPSGPRASRKELRQFGLMMGAFLVGLFGLFFPWVFEKNYPNWPWYAGSVFAAFGLAWPGALGPVFVYWMKFSHVLGWINSRILLGVCYYLVVAPIGLFRRALGKDALDRKFDKKMLTYRVTRDYDKTLTDMERPF